MELAKRIRLIRKEKGLTQNQVAEAIGVSQPSYSDYETKAGNCAFYTLQKIAKALDVTVPFLVDVKNEVFKEEKIKEISKNLPTEIANKTNK